MTCQATWNGSWHIMCGNGPLKRRNQTYPGWMRRRSNAGLLACSELIGRRKKSMKTNTQLIADLARCIPWMHKRQARQVLDVLTALWLDELGQPGGSIQADRPGELYVEVQPIPPARIVAPDSM